MATKTVKVDLSEESYEDLKSYAGIKGKNLKETALLLIEEGLKRARPEFTFKDGGRADFTNL